MGFLHLHLLPALGDLIIWQLKGQLLDSYLENVHLCVCVAQMYLVSACFCVYLHVYVSLCCILYMYQL